MLLNEIESIGKNVAEAIENGIKKLECKKEDVEIKILDEGSSGLFGLMGAKPARVLLTQKKQGSKNIVSNDEKKDIDENLSCTNVKSTITDIIKMMGISAENINVSFEDGVVNVDIQSDNGSILIGRGGQTLDSLEYVTQLIVNTNPKTRVKVSLNIDNYRLKQEERLKVLADKAIEYVKRTKKIYRFNPMPAKERKILHTYFKNLGDFETFSEGNGLLKKVGVKLAVEKK